MRSIINLPNSTLLLKGIQTIEFTNVVMCLILGKVLLDLGANVLYVEQPSGDPTRRMQGFGIGFFAYCKC